MALEFDVEESNDTIGWWIVTKPKEKHEDNGEPKKRKVLYRVYALKKEDGYDLYSIDTNVGTYLPDICQFKSVETKEQARQEVKTKIQEFARRLTRLEESNFLS